MVVSSKDKVKEICIKPPKKHGIIGKKNSNEMHKNHDNKDGRVVLYWYRPMVAVKVIRESYRTLMFGHLYFLQT